MPRKTNNIIKLPVKFGSGLLSKSDVIVKGNLGLRAKLGKELSKEVLGECFFNVSNVRKKDISPDETFLGVRGRPHVVASLSHTQEFSCAWVALKNEVKSVGIDIELAQRPVKPGMMKFYQREEDISMDALRLWSVKEAIFKCLSPIGAKGNKEKGLVLSDIIVNEKSAHCIYTPNIKCQYQVFDLQFTKPIIVSVAWIET